MPRIPPAVTPENEHFWRGGADGQLKLLRCADCGDYVHPPAPVCGGCLSRSLAAESVSGLAEVVTFTVNHQPWIPGFDPPYVVAIVELAEQPGLRLTTNIVHCPIEDVSIGLRVRVVFEEEGGVFYPLFEPAEGART